MRPTDDLALGPAVLGGPGAERHTPLGIRTQRQDNPTPPLAVSVSDAARLLSVSRDTIYRLIQTGKLRTVKLNGRRVVPMRELERLLEEGGEP